MRLWAHLLIIAALGFIYWLGSLFIASELEAGLLQQYGTGVSGQYTQQGGFEVQVAFSDAVDVSVRRNRWYGTIDEFSVGGKQSRYLALFDTFPVPLEARGTKFYPMHLLVICGLIFYAVGAVIFARNPGKNTSTKEVKNENLG